jgi:hypothetical protein
MLMVKVLAKLRQAHRRESLLVEGIMISTAQIAIQPEDEVGFTPASYARSTSRCIAPVAAIRNRSPRPARESAYRSCSLAAAGSPSENTRTTE